MQIINAAKAALPGMQKQREDALTADQKTGWTALLGDAVSGFAVDDLWLRIEEDLDLDQPPAPPGIIGK